MPRTENDHARNVNIYFDTDHTIIDTFNGLRPGVRELFGELREAGHIVYLWSGIGKRWEIVEKHALEHLVYDCLEKPLMHYERMLAPLGITARPEFVVDDHPHLVAHFGGIVVARYLTANAADREMWRVGEEIRLRGDTSSDDTSRLK